ncbi:MAG: hypothetical protein Q4A32_07940, partial [Lachnospiraceae bacterium]|nr:hypothetical protein [Lachnospiraceae bacterium]
ILHWNHLYDWEVSLRKGRQWEMRMKNSFFTLFKRRAWRGSDGICLRGGRPDGGAGFLTAMWLAMQAIWASATGKKDKQFKSFMNG